MNRKFSIAKSILIAGALVTGASGIARADDSSMNPFTGDSYAYFNGCNLKQNCTPVFDKAPQAWRQSHPNGLSDDQFAALGSVRIAARLNPTVVSTAPADPTWRHTHPNGITSSEFAALGSEAIAARPSPNKEKTTAFASTK